jgi:hypothetical protein
MTTLIVIAVLVLVLAGGFHVWSQFVQRSQPPGRHRTVETQPADHRPAHRQSRAA